MSDAAPSFSRARGALLLAAVLLAAGLAFWAGGWRVRAFVSGTSDLSSYFVPKYQYAADRIAAGELPQWNPYEFGGIPFLATIQPGVFYPPLRVAYAFLSGETAYRVLFVAHLLVAALGALLLARDLRLALGPALVAAAWVTQPTWLVRLYDHPVYLTATTWIPWLLLASRWLVREPSARAAATVGLLAALVAVSGYPPLVLAIAYLMALGLPFWLLEERGRIDAARLGRVAAALAIAGAIAALVAAVQLLPMLELAQLTNRAAEAVEAHRRIAEIARMPSDMLFRIGVPQMTWGAALVELWRVFGPFLLLAGVLAPLLQPRRPAVWFALVATVLAAGLPFAAYGRLPLYAFVRFALEWAFVAPFVVYLLAALGLDALLARLPHARARLATPAALLVLALATWSNWRLLDPRWLQLDFGTPPPVPVERELCDVHDARFRSFWSLGQLRGSLMHDRVRSPTGYEQSLLPARSADLVRQLGIGNGVTLPLWAKSATENVGALSRFSVRCLLTPWAPILETAGFVAKPEGDPRRARVYVNERARPRARLEHAVRFAASPEEALAALNAGPLDGVILEQAPSAGDAAAAPCATAADDRVTVVRDDPKDVVVRTQSGCASYLVLADTLVPGWTATVNGEPAPILAADFAFRAVRLPPGEHEVAFRYAAPGLRAGAIASLVGLLAAALLLRRR